jgi:hypothetical protein
VQGLRNAAWNDAAGARKRRWWGGAALVLVAALGVVALASGRSSERREALVERGLREIEAGRAGDAEAWDRARRAFRDALGGWRGDRTAHVGLSLTDALESASRSRRAPADPFAAAIARGDEIAAAKHARTHGGTWADEAVRIARRLDLRRDRAGPDAILRATPPSNARTSEGETPVRPARVLGTNVIHAGAAVSPRPETSSRGATVSRSSRSERAATKESPRHGERIEAR